LLYDYKALYLQGKVLILDDVYSKKKYKKISPLGSEKLKAVKKYHLRQANMKCKPLATITKHLV